MDTVSVIVPFLNEESCIVSFCEYIDKYVVGKEYGIELIFVDDGSNDSTVEMIESFDFQNCKAVWIINLSKNYGSHAAIRAGALCAHGDFITFIGADLQEPSDMLDVMYSKMVQGYDAVYIEKKTGGAGALNRLISLTYAALMRRFAVKNYGAGGVNSIMFNIKLKNYLNDNVESNSSVLLQIMDAGFKNITIPMEYKSRVAGKSKWTLSKKIKIFVDSFIAFSFAPIRMVSILGFLMSFLGFLYGAFIIINKFLHPSVPTNGFATLASLILIGFGITNISLGVIAEYLWRTYDAARKRPPFIMSEIRQVK